MERYRINTELLYKQSPVCRVSGHRRYRRIPAAEYIFILCRPDKSAGIRRGNVSFIFRDITIGDRIRFLEHIRRISVYAAGKSLLRTPAESHDIIPERAIEFCSERRSGQRPEFKRVIVFDR